MFQKVDGSGGKTVLFVGWPLILGTITMSSWTVHGRVIILQKIDISLKERPEV